MAETTTKTRTRDYWVVDLWAQDIGTRRFTIDTSGEALTVCNDWLRAFEDGKVLKVNHVRSFK